MELEDDSSRLVHRAADEQRPNYWVLGLLAALWILSMAWYFPGMPT